MRRLLLALLCCLPAFGAWNYSAALTYNSTLTGSASSSNFPALVSATNNSLCLTSNGTHAGYVQSSTGADIEFFADSGLTTQLASEIESYSGSGATCSVVAWVLIGTLSISANGTVYIAVGNASPPSRTRFRARAVRVGPQGSVAGLGRRCACSAPPSSSSGNAPRETACRSYGVFVRCPGTGKWRPTPTSWIGRAS